jgi:hypothetical protein
MGKVMVNYREIQNLKMRLLNEINVIDKKPQYGLQIVIKHKYLLNTDLSWIIDEIRNAIIKSYDISQKDKRRMVLTFRIHQVNTEHSILLVIIPGIVSGLLANLIYDLIKNGYKQLKEDVDEQKISIDYRFNIEGIEIQLIKLEDQKVKYVEKEKPITIKRNPDHPNRVRM